MIILTRQAQQSVADKLRVFELEYRQAQSKGAVPADLELVRRLDLMLRPMVNHWEPLAADGPDHPPATAPESSEKELHAEGDDYADDAPESSEKKHHAERDNYSNPATESS